MATAYVYMLRCRDDSFYVGSTTFDLQARVFQHQQGLGSEYTKRRLPVELVWHEEHENVLAAFAREKQVQGWSRAKRIALIEGRYADLPALSQRPPSKPRTSFRPRPRRSRDLPRAEAGEDPLTGRP